MGILRAIFAAAIIAALLPATSALANKEEAGKAGAESEAPNPMAVNPDLAIFTGVVFVVLLFVLSKFAWGPIAAGLEKREHAIADNIDAAEQVNKEAHQVLANYEQKLASAQEEIRQMLEQGRHESERAKQEILAEAKAGAQAEKDRGVREIELATDRALKELAEKSADLAVDLAGKIVKQKLSAKDHAGLIEDAVGKMAGSPSRN